MLENFQLLLTYMKFIFENTVIGFNEKNFEEWLPGKECDVNVGCDELMWKEFWGITAKPKLRSKSGLPWLQWEDFWETTPWLNLRYKSGLQWAAIRGLFRKM